MLCKARQVKDIDKWTFAKNDELDSCLSNQTWEDVELPKGKKALTANEST